MLRKSDAAKLRVTRNQGVVTAELLKTTVSGTNSVPEYLLQAGEVERELLRVCSKEINSTSTYRQSKTTQLNLRQFIESRGMKDIAFSDITEEFAESFKVFLKKELGHRNGHVNHCLCWLNRLIYIAVDREVLRANPIEDVAYERKEAPKLRHISRSELKRMMETPLPDPMMELARRTFIFSSLTGLAYADTRALHPRVARMPSTTLSRCERKLQKRAMFRSRVAAGMGISTALAAFSLKNGIQAIQREKILATKAACRPSLNLNTRLLIFLSNTDMSLHLVG